MSQTRSHIRAACAFALLAMCAGTSTIIARVPAPTDPNDPSPTMQLVKVGLYMISGAGGNSLVRLTPNGPIVVDAYLAGTYEMFRKKIRRISEDPTRFLIDTEGDKDHGGSEADFAGAGAQIIAHENAWRELLSRNARIDEKVHAITYERDYTVRLGGIEARLIHPGPARTDGDTVVYFPNLKVIAIGDLYASFPDPNYSAGGSIIQWVHALDDLLKLDFDIVVPSHGPTVDRAAVEAFRSKIEILVTRANTLAKAGVTKNELMARLDADVGWRLPFEGEQLDRFYGEISANANSVQSP